MPPLGTKQSSALGAAQTLQVIATTLLAQDASLQALLAEYTAEGYNGIWSGMATALLNTDGSLGTADGSPNVTHPITVGGIDRSATQLIAMMTFATDLHNFLNNVAVTAANRVVNLQDMVG